ncbi:MAG: hypothetical protein AAF570_16910 [Bacteroidota bacterium]
MSESKNIFVFAVCGAAEHTDTLNFSLPYLRKYSQNDILVVTDSSRNEGDIQHDNILDIRTPTNFDNHQASIYLKTGLHKFVDLQHNYCYLDSDVVAVREGVDEIFAQKNGPVTFGADHCRVREFSPSAVFCGCRDRQRKDANTLEQLLEFYDAAWFGAEFHDHQTVHSDDKLDPEKLKLLLRRMGEWKQKTAVTDPALKRKREHLLQLFDEARGKPLKLAWTLLFRILPRYRRSLRRRVWMDWAGNVLVHEDIRDHFHREYGYSFNEAEKTWYDASGEAVLRDFIGLIEEKTNMRFDRENEVWLDEEGNPVFAAPSCDHLTEAIQSKFDIHVKEKDWQHWNGGVFLFGRDSVDFLNAWHDMTLACFEDPYWRTRDQGTLIATCWKFGVQDQPVLNPEFNYIADYYKPGLQFDRKKGFSMDGFRTTVKPRFAHIYHHWGDENWDVWRWVKEIL